MMRIITGKARGVRLAAPKGEHTRPTAERTKEAVFSMLQFELRGAQVLDLFAGSGQMGLEAISRGAAHAVLCDSSREAINVIRSNAIKARLDSQCDILYTDFAAFFSMWQGREPFDLVFLDPPYAMEAIPKALRGLLQYALLRPDAKLICESAKTEDVFGSDTELAEKFDILKTTHYGIAQITVLQVRADGEREGRI